MLDVIQQAQTNDRALQSLLIRHEGFKLKPYRDTAGKLTIGVGRNLDDVGISRAEALDLLAGDLNRVLSGLDARHAWWRKLDVTRQHVLIDLAFNVGAGSLDGFVLMLAGLRAGAYAQAASELTRSKWAGQVGDRAVELAQMMRTGVAV